MSEYINVSELYEGDTIRLETGELIENITAEQIEEVKKNHSEIELIG